MARVLFDGADAGGLGLWVTDGTAAGTRELTGITGANAAGLLGHASEFGFEGLNPGFAVFNHEVLFQGRDADGLLGLWVTNGTAGGTRELTGITGAKAAGLLGHASEFGFEGLNPGFAVFNHEVLFQGRDADGLLGLWVTNGTAGGTHELTGIAGANPSLGLKPNGFTVLDDEVLFNGTDAAGRAGLWVTDGTAAGTHELTGITGASTSFVGLDPFGSTVFDSEVLFRGTDAAGLSGLWVTDGTRGRH